MIKNKTFLLFTGIIFILVNFVSHAWANSEPIRIGVSLGLTGPAALWSKYQRMGIELAIEDLKASGQSLEVVFEDSASQPQQAVANFKKLVATNKVQAVIGDVFSFLTEPMIPLANQNKILLVSPATPEIFCKQSEGYFFSTAPQVLAASSAFRDFLERYSQIERVALISFDDPGWGQQFRDGWRKLLKERDVSVVGEFESADFSPDFKTVLPKLLEKQPEAFFVAQQPLTFLAATKQLKFYGKLVFANNLLEIIAAGGSTSELEGVYFVDTLANEDFQKRFLAKFGELPILEAHSGYEAMRSLVLAIQQNKDQPELAYRELKYDGISGSFDFSKSCAGNQSTWHLKNFKNNQIEVLN